MLHCTRTVYSGASNLDTESSELIISVKEEPPPVNNGTTEAKPAFIKSKWEEVDENQLAQQGKTQNQLAKQSERHSTC